MAIGQGFQQVAGAIGGSLHGFYVHFHTCVYTMIRIYSQASDSTGQSSIGAAATQ
jgi:hypothetical protein